VLASIVLGQEAPLLAAGVNVASVVYNSPTLTVTLTTPVPDITKAIVLVTLAAFSGDPPDSVIAFMADASHISIQIQTLTHVPVFLPCFVRVALVP
jgi:hypothetical protein